MSASHSNCERLATLGETPDASPTVCELLVPEWLPRGSRGTWQVPPPPSLFCGGPDPELPPTTGQGKVSFSLPSPFPFIFMYFFLLFPLFFYLKSH